MDGNNMKSDIEVLMESQVWKRSSPQLKFRSSPNILLRSTERKIAKTTKEILIPDLNESDSYIFHEMSEAPVCFSQNSPVQVPLFPKLPFGKHSEMAQGIPKFKELKTNNEELMKIKLESGRIRRIVNESSNQHSPRSGIVNSIRLTLKALY